MELKKSPVALLLAVLLLGQTATTKADGLFTNSLTDKAFIGGVVGGALLLGSTCRDLWYCKKWGEDAEKKAKNDLSSELEAKKTALRDALTTKLAGSALTGPAAADHSSAKATATVLVDNLISDNNELSQQANNQINQMCKTQQDSSQDNAPQADSSHIENAIKALKKSHQAVKKAEDNQTKYQDRANWSWLIKGGYVAGWTLLGGAGGALTTLAAAFCWNKYSHQLPQLW